MQANARAQFAVARGQAIAVLAADYAARLGVVQAAGGPDMAARIEALLREQRQAEQALSARLKAEEKAQRQAVRQALKTPDTMAAAYGKAKREITRGAGDDGPERPEDLRRRALGSGAKTYR